MILRVGRQLSQESEIITNLFNNFSNLSLNERGGCLLRKKLTTNRYDTKNVYFERKLIFDIFSDLYQFFVNSFCTAFFLQFDNNQLISLLLMCFLKTLKPLDTIHFEKGCLPSRGPTQEKSFESNLSPSSFKQKKDPPMTLSFSKQDHLLLNLLNLVNFNTKLLQQVDQKLSYNDLTLKNCYDSMNQFLDESSSQKRSSDLTELSNELSFHDGEETADPLVQDLFGKKRYLYRLELEGEFSSTIYKERNINISVVLKNKQNQKVLNSNIIHLCLGVCDSEGNWISQNKAKESFMKGKTEVQMYHGEASFLKIYPKEVSRNLPGGKLNFVVYTKPSLLKFSSSSTGLQKMIDSELIQPLVINDISVKAKKKE